MNNQRMIQWFPMQVNPEQEQPVRQALERYGMESFQTSMVPGLIFVHSSREWLTTLKNTDSALFSLRFMNIHQKERPGGMAVTTICDREMENFIKAETLSDPDQQRIALTWTDFLGQEHRRVRIMQGPFMGVEGEVKRIGRHRIVVALLREAQVAVGITHIPPAALEFI